MVKRGLRVLGAAAAAVALLAACGSSDAQYVKNTDAGIFLKLPSDWKLFPVQNGHPMSVKVIQPEGSTALLGGGGGALEQATAWQVAFDGAPSATRADLEADIPGDPVGFVQVVPTEGLDIAHTLVSLRSILSKDGSDPLESPPSGFKVEDYQELEYPSGHWGIRMTVTEELSQGSVKLTQIALFDANSKRIYVVSVACSTSCYDGAEDQITRVLDSLTLQER